MELNPDADIASSKLFSTDYSSIRADRQTKAIWRVSVVILIRGRLIAPKKKILSSKLIVNCLGSNMKLQVHDVSIFGHTKAKERRYPKPA